jgi:transcriptional regulator with XRE-family HTH domain
VSQSAYRDVGRRLAAVRKRAGVSQDQLAALLQKPQSFVSACERGQRRIDVLELLRIAAALKLNPQELFAALVTPKHERQRPLSLRRVELP